MSKEEYENPSEDDKPYVNNIACICTIYISTYLYPVMAYMHPNMEKKRKKSGFYKKQYETQ